MNVNVNVNAMKTRTLLYSVVAFKTTNRNREWLQRLQEGLSVEWEIFIRFVIACLTAGREVQLASFVSTNCQKQSSPRSPKE
jgi:hypothetical protein